jgi:hypothetical protein
MPPASDCCADHTGHWARDDPALASLCAFASLIVGLAFGIVIGGDHDQAFPSVGPTLLCGFLGLGAFVGGGMVSAAVVKWAIDGPLRGSARADPVEWGFAFDAHCNAVVPVLGLAVVHLVLLPGISEHTWLQALVGNSIMAAAVMLYTEVMVKSLLALPQGGSSLTAMFYPAVAAVAALLMSTIVALNVPVALLDDVDIPEQGDLPKR